jgi:phage/plasmid-associated DNA primase
VEISDLASDTGDVTNSSIANYIVNVYNPFRYDGNSYYYSDGIYILDEMGVGKSKVSQIIDEIIEQIYPVEKLENKRIRILSEIQALIMMRNRFETDPFDQYDTLICCNNGILEFNWENETVTLLPHSPQYIFRFKFNFQYIEGVDTSDVVNWLKGLSTDATNKTINVSTYNNLIECATTAIVMQLTHGTFKLSYLVIGGKNSGKTTYTEDFLKKRFFGLSACSGTSLKSLCDDRFGKDAIIGKAANICDDITDSLVSCATEWKKLTGGARVEAEIKFGKKINVLFPMAIFNANDYPKLQNVKEDLAFWDRWKVIEFKNQYNQNMGYANENLDRLVSPFLLLVIKNVFKLHKAKSVVKNDELNKKLLENWRRDTDSFYSFINTTIVFDKDGYIRQKYLYDMYIEYCKEKTFKLIKLPIMFREEVLKLVSQDNERVTHEKAYVDYDYVNVFHGIRLGSEPEGNYVRDVELKKAKKIVESKTKEETTDKNQVKLMEEKE